MADRATIRKLRKELRKLGLSRREQRAVCAALEHAQESYERFHWGEEPEGLDLVYVPPIDPRVPLYRLGELVSVTYETTKGGGKVFHWVHEFSPKDPDGRPVLCCVPDGPQGPESGGLVIADGTYEVTERGIVG